MAEMTIEQAENAVRKARMDLQVATSRLQSEFVGNIGLLSSATPKQQHSLKDLASEAVEQFAKMLNLTHRVKDEPLTCLLTSVATGFAFGVATQEPESSPLNRLWTTLQRELVGVGELAILQMTSGWKQQFQKRMEEADAHAQGATNPHPPDRS